MTSMTADRARLAPMRRIAVGVAKARRSVVHVRPSTVWRLRDAAAVRRSLDCHPDMPEPPGHDELPLFAATEDEKRPTVATAGRNSNESPDTEYRKDTING